MKLIKSKLVVASVMIALSFGTLSFTTTPIYAETTVSTVSSLPLLLLQEVPPELPASALQDANAQAAAAAFQQAIDFAKQVAAGVIAGAVVAALSSSTAIEFQTLPVDALDQ